MTDKTYIKKVQKIIDKYIKLMQKETAFMMPIIHMVNAQFEIFRLVNKYKQEKLKSKKYPGKTVHVKYRK